jgi:hypothetical protein
MHSAPLIAGAAQQIAKPEHTLADAAHVKVPAAIGIGIDPSPLSLDDQAIVKLGGGREERSEVHSGSRPLLDLVAVEQMVGI